MYLESRLLKSRRHVCHGFTHKNRLTGFEHEIPIKHESWPLYRLTQVHSNSVHTLESFDNLSKVYETEGDALITRQNNVLIAVRTADCVPLLVYDPEVSAIAAIHAGWRGLLKGVIEATFVKLKKDFNAEPRDCLVVVGPCICEKCFEVGPEVVEDYRRRFKNRLPLKASGDQPSRISLKKAACLSLEDAGVLRDQIEVLPECTVCNHDRFYSFREGDEKERSFGFIGLSLPPPSPGS